MVSSLCANDSNEDNIVFLCATTADYGNRDYGKFTIIGCVATAHRHCSVRSTAYFELRY